MQTKRWFKKILWGWTAESRAINALAHEFNIEVGDARSLVESSGSVEALREELTKKRDRQARLRLEFADRFQTHKTEFIKTFQSRNVDVNDWLRQHQFPELPIDDAYRLISEALEADLRREYPRIQSRPQNEFVSGARLAQ